MKFNQRLALLRRERGLTQKQLGEEIGVTERNIRFYEGGGRRPTFDGLIALGEYFCVSIDYLVGRTERREMNR